MSTLFHTNSFKINEISPDQSVFAQITSHIARSPKRLWYAGKLPSERSPSVAIVGTRKPTAYGKEMAYRLSYELAERGVIIISGLALGIDGVAHQAALDAGGTTIAVLPTSLDSIHTRVHQKLARQIVESKGALITEYAPGSQVYKGNFLERNRIVSGLSDGVLIVEAAIRSGTLATANFALDQGRSVMVVPGNVTSEMSAGCNNLLKTGAAPITSVEDILHELGLKTSPKKAQQQSMPFASSPEEQSILQLIASGISDAEEIQRQSKIVPATFNQTLTMLEIEGKVRAIGANNWSLG